jgi:branched-chain amino acid transport system ATP-binding protein
MLEVRGLGAGYGQLQVLWEVSLEVHRGEWVSLVGSVGAGKTTLLHALAGLLPARTGAVLLEGRDVTAVRAEARVPLGMSLVPEGRRLYAGMTVAENLRMGAHTTRNRREVATRLQRMYELFPRLEQRHRQQVGTLSGGEQQMCAIARALMSEPRLLIIDELSLGLAPVIVDDLLETLVDIRSTGTTLLVVEQDVETALSYADRAYVLRQGRVVRRGTGQEVLLHDPGLRREYLGLVDDLEPGSRPT